MNQVGILEYLSFYISKGNNYNELAFNAAPPIVAFIIIAALVFAVFISLIGTYKLVTYFLEKKDKESSVKIIGAVANYLAASLIMFASFSGMTEQYNKNNSEISKENYLYLSRLKDFLTKDDIEEAKKYFDEVYPYSLPELTKLNTNKENIKIKEIVTHIDNFASDGVINEAEFEAIKKEVLSVSSSYILSSNDVGSIKSNLGIDITNKK